MINTIIYANKANAKSAFICCGPANALLFCIRQTLESEDTVGWQSFDLESHLDTDQYVTDISVVMKGTGSGAPGFKVLDARFIGAPIDNPTDTFYVSLCIGSSIGNTIT